ncbi:hypothetical protein AgCh_012909 [Apium graveolens]
MRGITQVVTFKSFQAVKLPEFKGEVDPVAARIWLKEMEKAFALTKVSEDLETDYASYFLKNDSNYWWESTRALEGEGERSVTEYEAKFTELARIALEYASLVIENYQRLAAKEQGEKKRKFEGELARSEPGGVSQKFQRRIGKNKDRKFRRQNFPQARPSTTLVSSTSTRFSKPVIDCNTCEKKHNGQCKENVNCFKCGQNGHYSTECKSETQGVTFFSCGKGGHIARNCRARTFKMTKKSPAQDSDVAVDLDEPLTIEVANKDKVPVSQFCPKCSVEISGYTFPTDLIPFELGDFDIILGMDWLSLYKANIDCKKKRVVMYTTDNKG